MEELLKELEEAKQKIADIEKKIGEKKSETGGWKPEEEDEYWFVDSSGQAMYSVWDNCPIGNMRYKIRNCFQSSEEAEFVAEKLKAIAELKEFAEPKNRAWDGKNDHYAIFFNIHEKVIKVACTYIFKSGEIYFESEEKARQAIDAVGESRIKRFYLGVEE